MRRKIGQGEYSSGVHRSNWSPTSSSPSMLGKEGGRGRRREEDRLRRRRQGQELGAGALCIAGAAARF